MEGGCYQQVECINDDRFGSVLEVALVVGDGRSWKISKFKEVEAGDYGQFRKQATIINNLSIFITTILLLRRQDLTGLKKFS